VRPRSTNYSPSVLRVEREHRFDASVEAGFAYITDTTNWPEYWPGFVRIEPGSTWNAPGDESTILVKLLGREVELRMVLRRLAPNELVEYESSQRGLPDAHHERHFTPDGEGFRYRLVVEYEPRRGFRGLYDRFLVRRGIERALQRTVANLQSKLTA
jgi:polyketide cyclase/dehydrase/lipid transport protein